MRLISAFLKRSLVTFTIYISAQTAFANSDTLPSMQFEVILNAPQGLELTSESNLHHLQSLDAKKIETIDQTDFHQGVTTWYHLILTNPSPTHPESWWFKLKAAHQSEVRAYFIVNGKIRAQESAGYRVPADRRALVSADLLLPLENWTEKTGEIYIKSTPQSKMPMLPQLITTKKMWAANAMDLTIISGYIGILLILMLYQLFIYQTLKDRASLDYALFCLTMALSGISRSGYFDMYFGSSLGSFYLGDWMIYWIGLNSFTALQFPRSFFQMSVRTPQLDRLFQSFLWGALIIYLTSICFKPSLLHKLVPAVNLFGAFLAISYSIYGIRKKLVGSIYYLAAWGGFSLIISIFNLCLIGTLPMLPFMRYLTYFAGLWEAFLTSLGLSHRLRKYRELEQESEVRRVENSTLRRMVRIICHDVANPLMVISAGIDHLSKSQTLTNLSKTTERLDRLRLATGVISQIIEDVRKLETVRTRKDVPDMIETDLLIAVKNSIALFEERSLEKNIQFKTRFSPDAIKVIANPNILQTNIIANILSNAIKFSHPNSTIDISVERTEKGVLLKVKDHGVGIPQEIMRELFTPGRESSRAGTQNERGNGFGMLLIREFTEAMGGSVDVHSKTQEESPTECGTQITIQLRPAIF